MHKLRGFSLIELLAGISVIAVLTFVVGYYIIHTVRQTQRTETQIAAQITYTVVDDTLKNSWALVSSAEKAIDLDSHISEGNTVLKNCFADDENEEEDCQENPDTDDLSIDYGGGTATVSMGTFHGYYPFTLFTSRYSGSHTALTPRAIAGFDPSTARPIRYTKQGVWCDSSQSDELCPLWAQVFFKPICSKESAHPCIHAASLMVGLRFVVMPGVDENKLAENTGVLSIKNLTTRTEVLLPVAYPGFDSSSDGDVPVNSSSSSTPTAPASSSGVTAPVVSTGIRCGFTFTWSNNSQYLMVPCNEKNSAQECPDDFIQARWQHGGTKATDPMWSCFSTQNPASEVLQKRTMCGYRMSDKLKSKCEGWDPEEGCPSGYTRHVWKHGGSYATDNQYACFSDSASAPGVTLPQGTHCGYRISNQLKSKCRGMDPEQGCPEGFIQAKWWHGGTYATDNQYTCFAKGAEPRYSMIALGRTHTCAISTLGSLYCWGSNLNYVLGDGTNVMKTAPMKVVHVQNPVIAVAAGQFHTCAVGNSNQTLYCWGLKLQSGMGASTGTQQKPAAVPGLSVPVYAVVAGSEHTCAIAGPDKKLYCWGKNNAGQLGINSITNKNTPQEVTGVTYPVSRVWAKFDRTCAVNSTGELLCWGKSDCGELGEASPTTQKLIPYKLTGLPVPTSTLAMNDATCGIKNGKPHCWGLNSFYQAGLSNPQGCTIPYGCVTTPGDEKAWAESKITDTATHLTAGANFYCGLTANKDAYCWGRQDYGINGSTFCGPDLVYPGRDPSNIKKISFPVGVKATSIAAGILHACAVTETGEVYCWGYNSCGQIGVGSNTGACSDTLTVYNEPSTQSPRRVSVPLN